MVLSGQGQHTPVTEETGVALGLDAGGTQMRWALVDVATGAPVAAGAVNSISALQLTHTAGRQAIEQVLSSLLSQMGATHALQSVCAGVSGVGSASEPEAQALQTLLADTFNLPTRRVWVSNDVELAYRDAFVPGQGYVVYAGTGSMAAFIDTDQVMHRAGGRGGILDDAGGGYWIAREALRQIWRAEDERPGVWRDSALAQALFEAMGGSDWATTRRLVYTGSRGAMGELALAVAAAADHDAQALHILQQAGVELARLAQAMLNRFGARPISLAGRVSQLHPVIAAAMQQALPEALAFQVRAGDAALAAARMAAQIGRDDL